MSRLRSHPSPLSSLASTTRVPNSVGKAMRQAIPRSNLGNLRSSLTAALATTIAVASLTACKKGASDAPAKAPPPPPIKVTTEVAGAEETPDVITLTGTAVADERSEVTADT